MNCSILVVDDELPNRRLLDAILVPEGYAVAHASSGKEALDRIAEGGIDLVLLDVLMPEMSGIEVCHRIRNDLGLSFLPVVMVTALADRDSRMRGKQAGADDFLTKPVFEDELVARVRNLLVRHDLFRSAERERARAEAEAACSILVSNVATSAVTCRDYNELRSAIEETLAGSLPLHSFALLETEHEGLRVVTPFTNVGAQSPPLSRIEWPSSQWSESFSCRDPILLGRTIDAKPFSTLIDATGASDGALVPLIIGGEVQGVMLLAFHRALSRAEATLLCQLSPHLVNAASNVRSHVKARELGEARERLAALLVHDFKNPLSIIKTNLYFLGLEGHPAHDKAEALQDCDRAADRLLSMVVDLMDVARAEEGTLTLERERVNVGRVLEDVRQAFQSVSESRGVATVCAPPPTDMFADIDRGLFMRVLENIVGNATRFTRAGGLIELSVRDEGKEVVVEIANDGSPIAAHVRDRLFEKYGTTNQTSQSTNRGLGLYFCRLVTEAHGGTIAAREREGGRGVAFVIRIPHRTNECSPSLRPQTITNRIPAYNPNTTAPKGALPHPSRSTVGTRRAS